MAILFLNALLQLPPREPHSCRLVLLHAAESQLFLLKLRGELGSGRWGRVLCSGLQVVVLGGGASAGASVPFESAFESAEGLFVGVDSASRNDGLGVLRDFGEEPKLKLPRMSRRESTIGRTLTCLSLSRAGVSTLERNHATALLGGSFDGRRWFVGDSYMSSSSRICPVSFVEINQRCVVAAEGGARAGYGIAGWLAWLSSSESIYCE